MHHLSLGHLTAIGLSTPEIIYLAADLGCDGVTINPGLVQIDIGGSISRLDDPEVRKASAKALADTGIRLDMLEPVGLLPDFSFEDNRVQLEIFAELGVRLANIAVIDDDRARVEDNVAAVCDLARSLSVQPVLESFAAAGGTVPDLGSAMTLVETAGQGCLKLLIDTLHLARAGHTLDDLAAIDPALIAGIQICDGPLAHPGDDAYLYESLFERAVPGEGELPLVEILRLAPTDAIVSPEVPLTAMRKSGASIEDCVRRVVEGTRAVQRLAEY